MKNKQLETKAPLFLIQNGSIHTKFDDSPIRKNKNMTKQRQTNKKNATIENFYSRPKFDDFRKNKNSKNDKFAQDWRMISYDILNSQDCTCLSSCTSTGEVIKKDNTSIRLKATSKVPSGLVYSSVQKFKIPFNLSPQVSKDWSGTAIKSSDILFKKAESARRTSSLNFNVQSNLKDLKSKKWYASLSSSAVKKSVKDNWKMDSSGPQVNFGDFMSNASETNDIFGSLYYSKMEPSELSHQDLINDFREKERSEPQILLSKKLLGIPSKESSKRSSAYPDRTRETLQSKPKSQIQSGFQTKINKVIGTKDNFLKNVKDNISFYNNNNNIENPIMFKTNNPNNKNQKKMIYPEFRQDWSPKNLECEYYSAQNNKKNAWIPEERYKSAEKKIKTGSSNVINTRIKKEYLDFGIHFSDCFQKDNLFEENRSRRILQNKADNNNINKKNNQWQNDIFRNFMRKCNLNKRSTNQNESSKVNTTKEANFTSHCSRELLKSKIKATIKESFESRINENYPWKRRNQIDSEINKIEQFNYKTSENRGHQFQRSNSEVFIHEKTMQNHDEPNTLGFNSASSFLRLSKELFNNPIASKLVDAIPQGNWSSSRFYKSQAEAQEIDWENSGTLLLSKNQIFWLKSKKLSSSIINGNKSELSNDLKPQEKDKKKAFMFWENSTLVPKRAVKKSKVADSHVKGSLKPLSFKSQADVLLKNVKEKETEKMIHYPKTSRCVRFNI